jgi:uncharacterized protein
VMGQKLFLEFVALFERPKLFDRSPTTASERRELFEGFVASCRWVEVHFLWRPNLPDAGDDHGLELAVTAGAETVVTYNLSDFRGELMFPGVSILTPSQFLKSMRSIMATMTIRLPDAKHDRLKQLAEQRGLSLNKLFE